MTHIEEKTLIGYFTINAKELENFDSPYGEDLNPIRIKFEGNEDGFSKLEKEELPLDKKLDLIKNLENLKKNNLIIDYEVTPKIRKNDIFIFHEKRGDMYQLISQNDESDIILVSEEIFELLKKQNKIVMKNIMCYNIAKE